MNLAIILATRGRPELLLETLHKTLVNITHPETIIMVSVDDDDQLTIDALDTSEFDPQRVLVSVKPRPDALGDKFNRVMVECPADVYLPMVDYCSHITRGFDDLILDATRVYPDGICVVYGPMANLSFPCCQAVTHKLAQMVGYVHPPYYPMWFGDHDLHDIATMIGRIAYVDLMMERSGKWPGTQNRRDMAFWTTFFERSTGRRQATARCVIQSKEFQAPPWLKEALVQQFPLIEQRSRIINAEALRVTAGLPEVLDSPQHQRLREAANKLLGREPISWPPPPSPPDPRSVMFLTPNLSYWMSSEFHRSTMQAFAGLLGRGVPQYWADAGGHPFPDYIRDKMATEGLRQPYPYQNFFWIDDDVGFPPNKIMEFLDRPEPVVIGVYPQKTDPRQPQNYFIDFENGEDSQPVEQNGLLKVGSKGPAGFMRVKRWVLEKVAQSYGTYIDVFPSASKEHKILFDIFRAGIKNNNRQYQGEDSAFISRCRELNIGVWCDPNVRFTHRGSYMWEGSLAENLKRVSMPIKAKLPSLSPTLDYSHAVYPDPPSHDFLTWLVVAEMMRRYYGTSGPLKVRFLTLNGMLGRAQWCEHSLRSGSVYQCDVTPEYYEKMLNGVLRPAIEMMGAVEEPMLNITPEDWQSGRFPEELQGYVEYDHHCCLLVDASRAGHKLPMFTPPQWAVDEVSELLIGRKPITITLREALEQPERNSNIESWHKFATYLKERGYYPLIIRDTIKANEPFFGFNIYPRASTNAYIRLALYKQALVNMLCSNGPVGWVNYSGAPFIQFKQLQTGTGHVQPVGWVTQDHLCTGEQYPWSASDQRLIWLDDTFENIVSEFEKFIGPSFKEAAE